MPTETPWPGLHLVKMSPLDSAPVLKPTAYLDASADITRFTLDRVEGADESAAALVAFKIGAVGTAEQLPEDVKYLALAAAEALYLIDNAKRRLDKPDRAHGYMLAMTDLRGSREIEILRDLTGRVLRLVDSNTGHAGERK